MVISRSGIFSKLALRIIWIALLAFSSGVAAKTSRVLFLGDQAHHQPANLHKVLAPYFAAQNIDFVYTEKISDLAPANLATYDALFLFNNLDTVGTKNSGYVKDYVDGGKGLMVVHCGIVFANPLPILDTVFGGRFARHDTGIFQAKITMPEHPAMKGVKPFRAWDETYEHRMTTSDKTVLMIRDTLNAAPEPWTWVRNQGKGRFYYTASGHDARVWTQAEFQKQLLVGLMWVMRLDSTSVSMRENPWIFHRVRAEQNRVMLVPKGNGFRVINSADAEFDFLGRDAALLPAIERFVYPKE